MDGRSVTTKELKGELQRLDDLENDRRIDALMGELKNLSQVASLSVRGQAAMKLGRLRANEAAEPLVDLLSDPDPHVRRSAARSLGMIGHRTAKITAGLRETIRADSDEPVRALAIASLGEIGEPSAVSDLVPLLSARRIGIRRSAIYALAISPDAEANALAEQYLGQERWSLRYPKRHLRKSIARFRRDGQR